MTVSVVQATSANGLFGAALSTGDVLFCPVAYAGSGTITSSAPTVDGTAVADATLEQDITSDPGGGGVVYEGWWLLRGIPAGGTQLGVTFTGGSQSSLLGFEVAGLPASLGTAVTSSGKGASSGPADPGSIGPVDPLIVVGATVGYGLVNTPPGAPWTSILGTSGYSAAGYQAAPGSGTYDYVSSLSGSAGWAAGIVALVAASSPVSGSGLLIASCI